jgi:hypothetical protein
MAVFFQSRCIQSSRGSKVHVQSSKVSVLPGGWEAIRLESSKTVDPLRLQIRRLPSFRASPPPGLPWARSQWLNKEITVG